MRKIAVLLLMTLLLSACSPFDDRTGKETILCYVEANQQELEQAIAEQKLEELNGFGIIQDASEHDDYVEFDCGGAGFGSQTAYRGFFYTETDDLYAIWCAPPRGTFTPSGDGWHWQEPAGDNECYVEHICGHFYYYEASF